MMKDITQIVCFWFECCRDVWRRWFKDRNEGAHEFVSIEQLLLETLVSDKLSEEGKVFVREEFFRHLQVRYRQEIVESRSFCVRQKAGNIFCKSREIRIPAGSIYSVRSMDTVGTMLDGVPYVEVEMDDGYILEPTENLEFYFSDEPVR